MIRKYNFNFASYDKKLMLSRVKKSQFCFDQIKKIEQDYSNLIDSPFKVVEVSLIITLLIFLLSILIK
jgi:hypothetical protein